MRACARCGIRVTVGSICRSCGGILQEVADEAAANGEDQTAGASVAEPTDADGSADAGPRWRCGQCGETHEPAFAQCWQCGAERHAAELPAEVEPPLLPPATCTACGSEHVVPEAAVVEQPGRFGPLQLTADVCGDCGQVQWRALDPARLLQQWQWRARTVGRDPAD